MRFIIFSIIAGSLLELRGNMLIKRRLCFLMLRFSPNDQIDRQTSNELC